MDNGLYSFALKNTLDEIRNLCPDITNAFVFRENGEITAADENTPQQNIVHIIDYFEGLLEKAETMGGIEQITIESSRGGANVSHIDNQYLVTITSENADKNYVNMITRTIVTTVLKLLDKISPAPLKNNPTETETTPEAPVKNEEEPAEQPIDAPEMEEAEPPEQPIKPEITHHEPTPNQLIVEDIQGLLVASDTVRIDKETLLQWQELCEDRKIEEVEVETFGGQSTRCKVKQMKNSKQGGKGIIQMPQRIREILETKEGELVRVKPIVE
jgi:hypothetical protein